MLCNPEDKILCVDVLAGKDADAHLAHLRLDKIEVGAIV